MEQVEDIITGSTALLRDVVLSGTWSYCIRGIFHFVAHPTLYTSVAPVLTKCLVVSGGITAGMFIFTYLPHVAFCAMFSGPLAFAAAAFMVLGESYALIVLVTKMFFLQDAQDKIFDAVLLQQGNEALVAQARQVKNGRAGFQALGKSMTKPLNRLSKEGLLRYIISLPLNSVPVIGTVAFLVYNGMKAGPRYHERYFQMKGFDSQSRSTFVDKRKGAYTGFGATALALDLVPIVGLLFNFTSTVGAALWASDLEKRDRGLDSTDVPIGSSG